MARFGLLLGAALIALAACGEQQAAETGGGAESAAAPGADGVTFGGPEAAIYDAANSRFLVSNVGARDNAEDGFILALAPDGSSATRWAPIEGDPPLGNPLGIAIARDTVYLVDTPYLRRFNLADGSALPPIEIPGAAVLNDVSVGVDGTVYVTDSGNERSATWAVRSISPDGFVGVLAAGAALKRPNGIDVGADGRIYVAAMTEPAIIVYAPNGTQLPTITAPHAGNDGIVVLPDGIILSSVIDGKVSFIASDGTSRLIAEGLPGAASIAYDPTTRRIAVPRVAANTVDFVTLE